MTLSSTGAAVLTGTYTIDDDGTTSNGIHTPGHRLVALVIPAMDSTVIAFDFGVADTGYVAVKTNTHGAAPAVLNLGSADTGSRVVAVPEEVGRLAGVGYLRLNVATQAGGPRTVTALYQRVEGA